MSFNILAIYKLCNLNKCSDDLFHTYNHCSSYITHKGFNFCCIVKDTIIKTSHVTFFLANRNTDLKMAFPIYIRITLNIFL